MRNDEQWDPLHALLARASWDAHPTVRLTYHEGDDALVAEIGPAGPERELELDEHLIVDLDGPDPAARPTALHLTGVRTQPSSVAVRAARHILGEQVWTAVEEVVAAGSGTVDVVLDESEAAARRTCWLEMTVPAMIGVEFTPGRVYAVLTDAEAAVLDEEAVDLDRNDPAAVVAAIAAVTAALAARHPGTAQTCPVAVQLGGPVNSRTGVVTHYDKPLHDDDQPWKWVSLDHLVKLATGRPVKVFNDAEAFALWEVRFGIGRDPDLSTVAVLVVRDGVGAKLLMGGEVLPHPMEIGVFRGVPGIDLDTTPDSDQLTIEARSGARGIVRTVEAVSGSNHLDLAAAAALAERDELVAAVFRAAGEGLARGIAAIQAVVDPQRWVVYGPAVLVEERTVAGSTFLAGLRTAQCYLSYDGLGPVYITGRSTTGPLGAQAAAVAALR